MSSKRNICQTISDASPSRIDGTHMTNPTQLPQAFSSYSASDYPLDTDLSTAFWRGAPVIILARNNFGDPIPGPATEVRSRWSRNYLYLLFSCPYDTLHLNPSPQTLHETNKLWEWDVAEVFIGSDFCNIHRYKEFEVSPQAEFVDLDVDLDNLHHEDGWLWSSGFEVAARIDAAQRVWYGSMRIPFAAVDSRPVCAGDALLVNFFRSHNHGRTLIAWQPTMQSTFHVPEAFGTLVMKP